MNPWARRQRRALRDGYYHRSHGHWFVCAPFALGYYAAARSRVPPSAATRHIWPYLDVLLIAPIIVVFFLAISTTLL
jgi:hypothetical protein